VNLKILREFINVLAEVTELLSFLSDSLAVS